MAALDCQKIRTMRLSRVVPVDESRDKYEVQHRCSICKHCETNIVDLEHLDEQLRAIYRCKESACRSNGTVHFD